MLLSEPLANSEPHTPGGAFDNAHRALDIGSVEVACLDLGNLPDLVTRYSDRQGLGFRVAATLIDPRGLAKQLRGRWALGDKGKRTVFEYRQLNGNYCPRVLRRPLVLLLDERHDVDAVLSERGTYRRGGTGPAAFDLELYECAYFLGQKSYPMECIAGMK